ncbi:hypothetical protein [Hyphomicrobium sp.]|uniref:hypothetical protein n=1 Tax=Hyphomicrobium sp. TaxID=82 RepID=UPI002BAC1137|nr:hypothetical protein [Hyphomicrobium sp.]HRN87872.1 hypothetical protein [Hyphomicrobium sp.]HRQ27204.1 hypothetical protein [Hyphomicrobium sp.]
MVHAIGLAADAGNIDTHEAPSIENLLALDPKAASPSIPSDFCEATAQKRLQHKADLCSAPKGVLFTQKNPIKSATHSNQMYPLRNTSTQKKEINFVLN